MEESGSELVERTVQMFWHSISLGGEPGEVGNAAAFFSSKIAYLRASRKMVALTFEYLILPLQIALVGLLEFILEIMDVFSSGIGNPEELTGGGPGSALASTSLDISTIFTFGQINMGLVNVLVTSVVLVIMGANSFAPRAAAGGHGYNMLFYLTMNMVITGALMLAVPAAANSVFSSILESRPT